MEASEFLESFLQSRRMLLAFVTSILPKRDLAEDVFQDVALIAFRKCGSFRAGTNFGAWLREIARRRILKIREGAGRAALALEPEAIEAVSAAHGRVTDRAWADRGDALQECLKKLPERSRQLVELRYRDGLGFDAIADRLRSTMNSVQVVLSKVRKALRQCVETKTAESPP